MGRFGARASAVIDISWKNGGVQQGSALRPGASAVVRDEMPESERDAAYFKAVLEHIRRLVQRTL
jgi:hypothetical protein